MNKSKNSSAGFKCTACGYVWTSLPTPSMRNAPTAVITAIHMHVRYFLLIPRILTYQTMKSQKRKVINAQPAAIHGQVRLLSRINVLLAAINAIHILVRSLLLNLLKIPASRI